MLHRYLAKRNCRPYALLYYTLEVVHRNWHGLFSKVVGAQSEGYESRPNIITKARLRVQISPVRSSRILVPIIIYNIEVSLVKLIHRIQRDHT